MTSASSCHRRAYAHTGTGPSANPFWPSGGVAREPLVCRWWTLGKPMFVAMIIGFVVFWPIGLGILFYNIWNRSGGAMPFANLMERAAPFQRPASTGNAAFDDWRTAEIERIEAERRKLAEAEQEFRLFLDELKRAKDREEFERFMKARKERPTDGETTAS